MKAKAFPSMRGQRADKVQWLPLEGKLSQPIPREAVTDEVELPVSARIWYRRSASTSSVIRLA